MNESNPAVATAELERVTNPAPVSNGRAPKLDEKARRKPDFGSRVSVPVVLADGQEWHVAKPIVRFIRERTLIGFGHRSDMGSDYNKLLDEYISLFSGDDFRFNKMIALELQIAEMVLSVNYDLSFEEMQELIQFTYGPIDERPEYQTEILNVALGRYAPKVPIGGSDLVIS